MTLPHSKSHPHSITHSPNTSQSHPNNNQTPTWKRNTSVYLCCDSCLRQGRASILDNRSISLWSCTAHTPGCTSGDGCSSPLPHKSCCWSPGGAPGDKNTPPPSRVPPCTGGCSHLWLPDTYLRVKRGQRYSGLRNCTDQQKLREKVRCQTEHHLRIYAVVSKWKLC